MILSGIRCWIENCVDGLITEIHTQLSVSDKFSVGAIPLQRAKRHTHKHYEIAYSARKINVLMKSVTFISSLKLQTLKTATLTRKSTTNRAKNIFIRVSCNCLKRKIENFCCKCVCVCARVCVCVCVCACVRRSMKLVRMFINPDR